MTPKHTPAVRETDDRHHLPVVKVAGEPNGQATAHAGWINPPHDIICTRSGEFGTQFTGVTQDIVLHSPTGMEWGYGGSGPADLALNILAPIVGHERAIRLYGKFKFDIVATLPRSGGTITSTQISEWLGANMVVES
jgi:hypothetical protein